MKVFAQKLKYVVFRNASLQYYKKLKSNESLTRDELFKLNWEKRKELVKYATLRSRFYHEFYDLSESEVQGLNETDFISLPVLEKSHLRESFNDIQVEDLVDSYARLSSTGGSTGAPVKVLQDKRVPVDTIQWRAYDWWGVEHEANWGRAWRIPVNSKSNRLMEAVKWWPSYVIRIDASSLDEKKALGFLRKLSSRHFQGLFGYVGALRYLAEVALKHSFRFPLLKVVWSTSAPLTDPVRLLIRSAFGCPVMDEYGSCEIMRIAVQRNESSPLVIHEDIRHVEILDDAGKPVPPGVVGNIVVTDLENKVFPLIRYKIGDKGALLPDAERHGGLPFSCLQPVKGRNSESFNFPCGINIPGEFLTTIFDDYSDHVSGFQVILKKDFSVVIKYVSDRPSDLIEEILKKVTNDLAEKLHHKYPVRPQRVANIPADGGKIRYVFTEK